MGKNPAFQLYPGDWFREPGLQRVDLDVRGAWAELLMMMHHEAQRGVSTGSISGLARQLRISIPRACFIVEQLMSNGIADVEYLDEDSRRFIEDTADAYSGHVPEMSPECPEVSRECPYFVTLKNRRMINEEKVKEYERLKKQKQRQSPHSPVHVPEMSPSLLQSPSPSPSAVLRKEPPLPPPLGGPRKRGNVKPTDPKVPRLIAAYHSAFLETLGTPPPINGAKCGAIAKALLRGRPYAEAEWLVAEYFRSPPQFYAEKNLNGMEHVLAAAPTLLSRSTKPKFPQEDPCSTP